MQVVLDRVQGANAWLTVGLREGKNREIRRAMTEIGLTVNRLIRVSYGPFRLNDLQPGQVEEVRPRTLKDQLGFDPNGDEAPEPAKRSSTAKPGRKPATAPKAGAAPKLTAAAKRPARPAAGTAGARLLDSAERFMDGPRKFTAKPRTEKPRAETDRGPTAPRRSAGPKPTGPKPTGAKPAGPRPSGPKPTRSKR
jgi:23S rRNA pseudouridine2605 synthase